MIAVDWGTSSFRAYRVDDHGSIKEKRAACTGILHIENATFAATLETQIGDWLAAGETPILMSGMIGARQGWVEAPYCECPAGLSEIASKLRPVSWPDHRAWIAPGVCGHDATGTRDVMRGEEVQILGSLESMPNRSGLVCLPGTHSKWVQVHEGKIIRFETHMTGEVFAVLKQHSLLGRMMKEGAPDHASFLAGVSRARQVGGLLHHLFGVRARGLFGEITDVQAVSYLSGILIGHELKAALESRPHAQVFILGSAELNILYSSACDAFGLKSAALDPESGVRGLFLLSQYLN